MSFDLTTHQRRANDVAGGLGSFGRVFRMLLQSAVLGVGAYLVILQEASAGVIIAASILTGRALAPVDLAIANWKGFVSARQSWQRLQQLFAALPALGPRLLLHAAGFEHDGRGAGRVPRPERRKLVAHDINFTLKAGSAVGIIGPSASGKSSLVRAMVGVWLARPWRRAARRSDAGPVDAGGCSVVISDTCRRTSS